MAERVPMKKLNVAIVGFGFMGRTHYGVWKRMRNARVVCVCDSNLAQITAKAKGNLDVADNSALPPSVRVYDDLDRMLATERLEVIDITLPTPLHAPMAIKALARDINVLCEKPMAVDAKTCDRMVAAERRSKGKLMIAQCVRYWPEYRLLKGYVDSGKFGKVIAAGAFISLCIELMQLPFATRVTDIDDLILNTLGVMIGYGIYSLVKKIKTSKR